MIAVAALPFVHLTDAELEQIVRDALGGPESLDDLVSSAIFDGQPPEYWGDWPQPARKMHAHAVMLWKVAQTQGSGFRPRGARETRVPTLLRSWSAFRRVRAGLVLPSGLPWWRVPNMTWGHIASELGIGAKATSYHFGALGWRFDGSYSSRAVLIAPCAACGEWYPSDEIAHSKGPCCRG